MKSKVKFLAVLAVIVSSGLVACAVSPAAPTSLPPTPTPVPPTPTPVPPTPTPSITLEDLIGVWNGVGRGTVHVQVNEDGTYRTARTIEGLERVPLEVGQFRLEGTLITFITSDESQVCAGQSGRYEIGLTEEGHLQFVLQEDTCEPRARFQPGLWGRVEP